ncbi:MAG: class I SAM-dependent methyltransferase [Chloroflexota bacterium]|nr:class I SAM-dependent methyltransferase [Chloroflexota bacterium]
MTADSTAFSGEVAARYDAWYETPEGRRVDELEKAALRWLLEGFPRARSVLEVGCGTGHFTHWMHEEGLAAVGADLSAAMLAEVQAVNGVSLAQSDAYQLPFADDTFDLTVFVTTLEFLEQPNEALKEALRVARQGVVLGVLNRWSVLGLQRKLVGLFRPTVYDAAHFYSVGELRRLLLRVRDVRQARDVRISWRTTLFPRWWPQSQSNLPWGGFIAMAK